jgi:hypothetical protein
LKAKAESFPAAALLTVASIPPPALLNKSAGVMSDRRLELSAVPSPVH